MSNKVKATAKAEEVEPFKVVEASFEFEGDTYTVSSAGVMDVDFIDAYESGKTIGAIKFLVGEQVFAEFKANGKNGKRDIFEANAFMDLAMRALNDVSSGESED